MSGTTVNAALGYSRRDGDVFDSTSKLGFVAALFENGINVAFAVGSRDEGGDYYYTKLGYRLKALSIRETSLAIDYYDGEHFDLAGRESD